MSSYNGHQGQNGHLRTEHARAGGRSKSPSATPDKTSDFQHPEFTQVIQDTRNSLRWAKRRGSLQKGIKKSPKYQSSHKSAAQINRETEEEERQLRERRQRELAQETKKRDQKYNNFFQPV